jgi:hypothetical protein
MIVKVKYYSESKGKYSDREYTYLSEDALQVGDVVMVPVRDTTGKAIVAAVDVPESEIEAFKDKIKTIPSGSLIDVAGKPEHLGNFADIFDDPPMPYEDYLEALEEDIEADRYFDKSPTDPVQNLLNELDPKGTKAIIQIKPEEDPTYAALVSEVAALCRYADMRVIKTPEDAKAATDDLNLIRKLTKSIEDLRNKYVRPINEHVKTINDQFKNLSIPLSQADKTTQAKILAYQAEVKRKAEEAEEINRQKLELARKEAALNGTGEITIDTTPVIVPEVVNTVRTETATVGVRSNWKAEVVDFAALSDEFKLADMVTLNALARSRKGKNPPSGVRFYDAASITVRSR